MLPSSSLRRPSKSELRLDDFRGDLGLVWPPDQLIDSPIALHAESVGYSIDVDKPGRNQRNLQDSTAIETDLAQANMVGPGTSRCIFREFDNIVKHHAVLL